MLRRLGLGVQHLVAQLFIPLTFGIAILVMRGFLGYRWEDLRSVRHKISDLIGTERGPLLICPNHLTMIDSLLLIWAMTPFWKAIGQPRLFPWNTPEKTHFSHIAFLRFATYVGKCLPVVRQGPPAQTRILMAKLKQLLGWGQSLMIFPEGTRSVSGRLDTINFTYGVGKILHDLRQEGIRPRVLLMYLRGKGQVAKSTIPRRRENFYLDATMIAPQTASNGLRATRDLSTQIIAGLAGLEVAYFAR